MRSWTDARSMQVQAAGCWQALRKDARWIRIGIIALLSMNVTSAALEFSYNIDRNVFHAGDTAWVILIRASVPVPLADKSPFLLQMTMAFKGFQARAIWYLCVARVLCATETTCLTRCVACSCVCTVTFVQVFVVVRLTEFSKAIYGSSVWRKAYTIALAALCLCTGSSGILALHFRGVSTL